MRSGRSLRSAFLLGCNFLTPPRVGSNGLFSKEAGTRGEFYKLSGRKERSPARPRRLSESGRPPVFLMMSLPSLTETHCMIILQIKKKPQSPTFFSPLDNPPTPPPLPIHHPAAYPPSPSSYLSALSYTSTPPWYIYLQTT